VELRSFGKLNTASAPVEIMPAWRGEAGQNTPHSLRPC
jgi:hypothetical protein